MTDLAKAVAAFCQTEQLIQQDEKIVIGVSGGPDSVCLLHWLREFAADYRLQLWVAHLNHGLRGQASSADAAFVAELAESWHLPYTIHQVEVAAYAQAHKLNLEDAARQKRYQCLVQVASEFGASKIAVGHNANDQAETLLLHLLRGAGLAGLSGIQPQLCLADLSGVTHSYAEKCNLIRPLLQTSRADIEAYCQAHQLVTRNDASNQDTTLLRNRIRHELLPLLSSYNPSINETLTRTTNLLRANQTFLQLESDQAWERIKLPSTDEAVAFDVGLWQALPLALQRETVRHAIQLIKGDLTDILFDHIELAINLLKRGTTGQEIHLPGQLRFRLHYQTAIVSQLHTPLVSPVERPLLTGTNAIQLEIPGCMQLIDSEWQVRTTLLNGPELDHLNLFAKTPHVACFDADLVTEPLQLRRRQTGDTFAPLGLSGHHQSVKRFMINQKINAAQRNQIPLLVDAQGQIHWICGQRQSHLSRVTANTNQAVVVAFERSGK